MRTPPRSASVAGEMSRFVDTRDLLLALALTAFVELEVFETDVDSKAAAAMLALLVALPLAVRRLQPLSAGLSAVGLGALGHLNLDQEPQTVLIVVLAAAYSAGAHADGRRAYAALGLIWLGWIVNEPGDAIVQLPITGGAFWVGRLLRTNREQYARLSDLADELERERADHARLAIAEERARIARELHDVVAHAVSVMVMQAGGERMALGAERPGTRETLAEIEHTGRAALAEMRRLVGMLRADDEGPALAPAPSLEHLDALIEHVGRAGLPVELRREGKPVELSPGLEITAYRIIQEALTNTLKHAGPARATVHVRYSPAELRLTITDDGRGDTSASRNGHGLPGMQERVALFGGRVETGSGPEGGYRVRAWLPVS
jgi:signal transduction histidine kinase